MALPGIPIDENQCIGDSLFSINNALTALDKAITDAVDGAADGTVTNVTGVDPIQVANGQTTPSVSVNMQSLTGYLDDHFISRYETLEVETTTPTIEQGFIKQWAKMAPSASCLAAITTTNRVVAWGAANGGEASTGGKLAKTFAASNRTPPNQYIRVPFYSSWSVAGGADGAEYLDENPTVKIVDLYWNSYGAMALLSNGTCWVAGYNGGDLGVGAAASTAAKCPTCGFVKVTFGSSGDPQPFIKRIQAKSDNNTSNWIFTALDSTDTLWVWGNTKDGAFGSGHAIVNEAISLPKKLATMSIVNFSTATVYTTTETVNFENQILDYEITAVEEAATALCIVTKDNNLYISGDNTNGQRGTGFKTASGLFNRAKTSSTAYVTNALKPARSNYAGRQYHLCVTTSGGIVGCGDNAYYCLGNNSNFDAVYFTSATIPAGVTINEVYPVSYHYSYVMATATNISGKKLLYGWGYNGTIGFCGVDSTSGYILVPTICRVRTGGGAKINVEDCDQLFISDQVGRVNDPNTPANEAGPWGAVCYVNSDGYAHTCGFSNFNDPPEYINANAQYFTRVPLKNVKQVVLGGDVAYHRWNAFLLKNGTTWGMGDAAQYLFGVGTDTVKHPARMI